MQVNLMPDASLFAVMAIFIVNYFVVSRFFIRPFNDVLEAREHDARTAQEIYEQALARFNQATAQIEERMHVAKREASQLRERFRADAAQHRGGLIERTSTEAKRLITDAETRLGKDVQTAREKLVRDAEALARLAAERILGRAL
jgi:F0F1-type ATP synthase membrane subunit b/b'